VGDLLEEEEMDPSTTYWRTAPFQDLQEDPFPFPENSTVDHFAAAHQEEQNKDLFKPKCIPLSGDFNAYFKTMIVFPSSISFHYRHKDCGKRLVDWTKS
jgi:hypothetical protein